MDRRIKKSKKAIEAALIELMMEKELEEITINAIAEKADVSRGTIYLNYEDKYHILENCFDGELNKLMEACMPNGNETNDLNAQKLLIRTLEYIEANATLFITLLENKGVQTFRDKLVNLIKDRMFSQIKLTGIDKGINRDIYVHFWSVAIIGTIEWWIKNSVAYSSEEIAKHLFNVLSRNEVITFINEI